MQPNPRSPTCTSYRPYTHLVFLLFLPFFPFLPLFVFPPFPPSIRSINNDQFFFTFSIYLPSFSLNFIAHTGGHRCEVVQTEFYEQKCIFHRHGSLSFNCIVGRRKSLKGKYLFFKNANDLDKGNYRKCAIARWIKLDEKKSEEDRRYFKNYSIFLFPLSNEKVTEA